MLIPQGELRLPAKKAHTRRNHTGLKSLSSDSSSEEHRNGDSCFIATQTHVQGHANVPAANYACNGSMHECMQGQEACTGLSG